MTSIVRVVRVGVLAALAVGLVGWGATRYRFGNSDQAALTRVEAELRQQLAASAETLGAIDGTGGCRSRHDSRGRARSGGAPAAV